MPTAESTHGRVLTELRRQGVLLESDKAFPNVARLVAGEKIEASLCGHKMAFLIFNVTKRLRSDPDVLEAKLVSGKVTFIHRRLWPELLAVCTSGEAWQTANLSTDAERLLHLVEETAEIRTDAIRWQGK